MSGEEYVPTCFDLTWLVSRGADSRTESIGRWEIPQHWIKPGGIGAAIGLVWHVLFAGWVYPIITSVAAFAMLAATLIAVFLFGRRGPGRNMKAALKASAAIWGVLLFGAFASWGATRAPFVGGLLTWAIHPALGAAVAIGLTTQRSDASGATIVNTGWSKMRKVNVDKSMAVYRVDQQLHIGLWPVAQTETGIRYCVAAVRKPRRSTSLALRE